MSGSGQQPNDRKWRAAASTDPNAFHPKAMPVILTTQEACAAWEVVKQLQCPLPDGSLTFGAKQDLPTQPAAPAQAALRCAAGTFTASENPEGAAAR